MKRKPRRQPTFADTRPAPAARHVGRCPVTGKLRYTSKADAKAAKKARGLKSCVYHCTHCGLFELGRLGDLPRARHREFHDALRRPDDGVTPTRRTR